MIKLPVSIRYPLYFLFGLAFLYFLQVASDLLIPLTISVIFTLILYPVTKKMELAGVPRILSITISMTTLALIIFFIFSIFTSQLINFASNFPALSDELLARFEIGKNWIISVLPGQPEDFLDTLRDSFTGLLNTGSGLVSDTISTTTILLANLVLIPIYIFLFLLYRDRIKKFIYLVTPSEKHEEAQDITHKIRTVLRDYVSGLMTVILIIAILNSAGLALVGLEYAVLFGCLAALLTIIPYFGILIGSLLPLVVALITSDGYLQPMGVIFVFGLVQFLEGNFLTPLIIGGRVSVNPVTAIMAILIGGKIWGTAGLILFVPLVAVLKVFLDAFESTRPYGMLLGDEALDGSIKEEPGFVAKLVPKLKKWFKKS